MRRYCSAWKSSSCTAGSLLAVEGSNTIRYSGFVIPPGGRTLLAPLSWPNSVAGRKACLSAPTITHSTTPGCDFLSPIGQANTPAMASLSCPSARLSLGKQVVLPSDVSTLDTRKWLLILSAWPYKAASAARASVAKAGPLQRRSTCARPGCCCKTCCLAWALASPDWWRARTRIASLDAEVRDGLLASYFSRRAP